MDEKILVTGCAGFIGFHVCTQLLNKGLFVIGIDNINNYYDQSLKYARLEKLKEIDKNFEFHKVDLCNKKEIDLIFENFKPSIVINLAAQAGVRYSIENPQAYLNSNLIGFMNIIENCKNTRPTDPII